VWPEGTGSGPLDKDRLGAVCRILLIPVANIPTAAS
jgi:hypothetical protein